MAAYIDSQQEAIMLPYHQLGTLKALNTRTPLVQVI